jgi:tetratricopeptide (TPR) repeat protein
MEERLEQAELDGLWLPGDPITSAERLVAAAAEPDRSELVRAELETQRARALGLLGRYEEAEALLDSLEPASGRLEVRVLLERGRLSTATGSPEKAVPLLEDAVRAAHREDDVFLAVDAALALAQADRSHAQQWIDEGLAALRSTDDPRTLRWGVVLHELRGWTLLDIGDAAAALAAFEEGAEYAERYGTLDEQFASQWALGRGLRAVGRVHEALAVQHRLATERPGDPSVAAELRELAALGAQPPSGPAPTTGSTPTIDS